MAAVTAQGTLRDRAINVLLLDTGLRARELCTLHQSNLRLGKRCVPLQVSAVWEGEQLPLPFSLLIRLLAAT